MVYYDMKYPIKIMIMTDSLILEIMGSWRFSTAYQESIVNTFLPFFLLANNIFRSFAFMLIQFRYYMPLRINGKSLTFIVSI